MSWRALVPKPSPISHTNCAATVAFCYSLFTPAWAFVDLQERTKALSHAGASHQLMKDEPVKRVL